MKIPESKAAVQFMRGTAPNIRRRISDGIFRIEQRIGPDHDWEINSMVAGQVVEGAETILELIGELESFSDRMSEEPPAESKLRPKMAQIIARYS